MMTLVAGKQIYANHYFEAGLDLTTVVDRPTAANPGIYLMLLRRSNVMHAPFTRQVSPPYRQQSEAKIGRRIIGGDFH